MRILFATGTHPTKKMGGAEFQTWLLAKGLRQLGYDSTFLATAAGNDECYIDESGMPVIEIPGWRIVGESQHKKMAARIIEEVKPDLLYIRDFKDITSLAGICKKKDIPYVTLSVHSMETSPFLLGYHPIETVNYLRSGIFFRHLKSFNTIRDSVVHVCNLRGLQTEIERWYPRKRIETIYNGSPVPDHNDTLDEPSGQVIWVNNFKRFKRPQVYVELARHLPDYRFVMVGSIHGGSYGQEMERLMAQAPPNLDYMGYKPINETNKLIGESDLLLYTSLPVEGFANSFMQAWFRGVPTVSYSFELDGIPEREGIGRCAKDFESLVSTVDELMSDHSKRQQMGMHAREFAVQNFSVDRMVKDYERLFLEILN